MKRIRIVGLCLVALFAMSAVAASSAFAEGPHYFECVKAKGGKFEKGCGKEGGKGGFSRVAPKFPSKYTATNGKSTLKAVDPETKSVVASTSCTKAKETGAYISLTEAETTVTFEKCTSLGKKCTSIGEKTVGDIKTNVLEATLSANAESKSGVAAIVGAKSGGASAEFNCEGIGVVTTGVVSGEVGAGGVEKAAKTGESIFATNEEGLPAIATGGSRFTLLTTITGATPEPITLPSGEETIAKLKGAKEIGVEL
jgi:hypothetical protein